MESVYIDFSIPNFNKNMILFRLWYKLKKKDDYEEKGIILQKKH